MISGNALIAALLASVVFAGPVRAAEATLKMVTVDMEEGAGTLFVTPEGRSLLVDTGSPTRSATFGLDGARSGADRVVAAARSLGVKQIDFVIVTHYHGGHIGGFFDLLARMPVGTFIDHGPTGDKINPGEAMDAPNNRMARNSLDYYARYLEAIKGHRRVVARPGDVIRIGSLTATIVASAGRTLAAPLAGAGGKGALCGTPPMADDGGVENALSVASILSFGKVRIAALGDLTWDREHDLFCPVDNVGHVNILLVSHHGTGLSSHPSSIAALRPDIAVMGNSAQYGAVPATVHTVGESRGLQAFWKMHASRADADLDGDPDFIANLQPAPDRGNSIRLDIGRSGRVTVTNSRNRFTRSYLVAGSAR